MNSALEPSSTLVNVSVVSGIPDGSTLVVTEWDLSPIVRVTVVSSRPEESRTVLFSSILCEKWQEMNCWDVNLLIYILNKTFFSFFTIFFYNYRYILHTMLLLTCLFSIVLISYTCTNKSRQPPLFWKWLSFWKPHLLWIFLCFSSKMECVSPLSRDFK